MAMKSKAGKQMRFTNFNGGAQRTHMASTLGLACAALLALTPLAARANPDKGARPYAFSGACSSQGIWTQQALNLTQQIRSFTLQLKNDPNCQALGVRVQTSLQGLAERVRPAVDEKYSYRLSQLPQEIGTLLNEIRSPRGGAQSQAALMRAVVQEAALASHLENESGGGGQRMTPVLDPDEATGSQSNPVQRFSSRFTTASRDGLALFNDVVDAIPQMQQCLTDDGVSAGQVIATSVKLLTSFVASGQDQSGSGVATALSKLTQTMREAKFTSVLTKLNQADFLASLSCLIELTTENYCTTRDSKILFDDMMNQLQSRPREGEQKRLGADHPLTGYYILTQNLPIITNWIQRVQIGVDPRVPTDATFQNHIFDDVNSFFKMIKVLQGNMQKDIEAMKTIPDLKGRQNAARQFIQKVTNLLNGGSMDDLKMNFFSVNGSSREMMFLLMDIPIPPEVLGRGGGMAMEPSQWLDNNYMTEPAFKDPDLLVQTVMNKVFSEETGMVATAKKNAILYYNKWFVIDKISLVNESFLGMNYNVKNSLVLINDYLLQMEKRLRSQSQDLSMIGGLRDTRSKIANVLKAYQDLEKVVAGLSKESSTLTAEEKERVSAANVAIISAVYQEFEVLLGKSGWFANRIVKFIYQDYLNMLKSRQGFAGNTSDLAYAAGLSIFDRLMSIAQGNPAAVQNDLASALRLNKMNLEAVESLIGNYFVGTIAELQAVSNASNQSATFKNRAIVPDGATRAWRDQMALLPGQKKPSALASFFGREQFAAGKFWGEILAKVPGLGTFFGDTKYSQKYDRFAFDDEFGSARRLFEQFCVQSLAFSDVRSYYSMCENVVLKSPFPDALLAGLPSEERQAMTVAYKTKLSESMDNAGANLSKRICAFRDYNRKNLVMYLTTQKFAP